jgi:hypothetical protein
MLNACSGYTVRIERRAHVILVHEGRYVRASSLDNPNMRPQIPRRVPHGTLNLGTFDNWLAGSRDVHKIEDEVSALADGQHLFFVLSIGEPDEDSIRYLRDMLIKSGHIVAVGEGALPPLWTQTEQEDRRN